MSVQGPRRIMVRRRAVNRGAIRDRFSRRRLTDPQVCASSPITSLDVRPRISSAHPEDASGGELTLRRFRRRDLLRPRDAFARWYYGIQRRIVTEGAKSLIHPVALVGYAMLIGGLLRGLGIDDHPPGFNQDEALAGYDAWSLWQTLRDHHGDGLTLIGFLSFGDWVSPFLSLFLIPFVGLLGLEIWVVRLGTVVLGIAAIPLVYLLTVELTRQRWSGAAAAWFLAISPWAVHLSRFAIPPATVVPLVALTAWLLLRACRLRSTASIVWASVATGLLVLGYPTMKLFAPLLVGLILVLFIRDILDIPIRRIALGLAIIAMIAGPTYLFFLLDPAAQNRQQYVSVFNQPDFGPALFLEEYWAYLGPNFLFERAIINDYIKGEPWNAEPGYGVELLWIAPFLVIGLLAVVGRAIDIRLPFTTRRWAILLLGLILLSPLTGAFTYWTNSARGAQLALFVAIVTGIGLETFVRFLLGGLARVGLDGETGSAFRRGVTVVIVVASLLPLVVEARSQYRGYFVDWPRTFGAQYFFHSGLMEALEYAESVEDDYDEIWVTATNQGYMFRIFSAEIDPVIVHEELRPTTTGFVGYHVEQLGSYHFTRPYAGPPEDLDLEDVEVVFESFPQDTGRGYVVWQLTQDDGTRVLVIQDRVR